MAPEVIRHESYSSNADVYSFGICLWQLITRVVPFATMTPIQAAFRVAEGDRPPMRDDIPKRLREIIVACWDSDSYKRPSFTWIAMALADYAKDAFSPANVGTQTLMIANEMLANVEGNATVNVDFSATLAMGAWIHPDDHNTLEDDDNSNIGLEI
jgi:serine/threonine protein kinase